MEKYYYFKPKFASARIGAEVGNYVIILYKGTHVMKSYGFRIKNDTERVFDLRRGKIVNSYQRFNEAGDSCVIYDATMEVSEGNIFLSSPLTHNVFVDYQELYTLYNPMWYQEKIASITTPKMNPLLQKEFYAKFFNVPIRKLELGILYYQKPQLSFGYMINDGCNRHAVDVGLQKLILLPKEKCVFYKATKQFFMQYHGSKCWFIETQKRDFNLGGENGREPIQIEVDLKRLKEKYDRMWYDPSRALIARDWAPAGEW